MGQPWEPQRRQAAGAQVALLLVLALALALGGVGGAVVRSPVLCLAGLALAVALTHALLLLLFLCVASRRRHASRRATLTAKVRVAVKSCAYLALSCLFFHAVTVLFGAPVIHLARETFVFSILLTTFTALPCLCILGPNLSAWLRVFTRSGAVSVWEQGLCVGTTCTLMGAWLGALPIPLDWDRPWQAWPITCSMGAVCGYALGLLLSLLRLARNGPAVGHKKKPL
ncbi:GPI ethanolamine phosphate transferase, stabilizing subunit [Petromyzon marinus]|uniref:GPI ethanolamine phosphate transferase, stabilizing subunit n=1 Tax=Petromyzon marinus TaxID=7757 RepID=UPI003F6EFC97